MVYVPVDAPDQSLKNPKFRILGKHSQPPSICNKKYVANYLSFKILKTISSLLFVKLGEEIRMFFCVQKQ